MHLHYIGDALRLSQVIKEDAGKCLACGMDDHLAKPIDIEAVFQKIKRYSNQYTNDR